MEEKEFYGQMQLLEEQRKTVQIALEGLAVERAGVVSERAAAVAERRALQQLVAEIRPTIESAAGDAIGRSMSGVIRTANDAAEMLSLRASSFLLTAAIMVLGTAAVVGVAAWGGVAWQQLQVSQLINQRADLTAEIEQMKGNVAELAAKGGRIRWHECDGGRRCIEASKTQVRSMGELNYEWAAWYSKDGTPMVIPNGY